MNILAIAMFERNSQNPKIMRALCDAWVNQGHKVTRLYPCATAEGYERMRLQENVRPFILPDKTKYDEVLHEIVVHKRQPGKLLAIFSKHPVLFIQCILRRIPAVDDRLGIPWIIKREIEAAMREKEYDCLVAGSNPFYLVLGAAKAKCNCKKIWYQMDPHSENGIMLQKYVAQEQKKERFVYQNMDEIYIQPQAYASFAQGRFQSFAQKVHPVCFPLISREDYTQQDGSFFKEGKTNCVFAGALMIPIRRPEYMLKLFAGMQKENVNLHIWSGHLYQRQIDELQGMLFENQQFHGGLPQDKMKAVLNTADFLVNLGNTETNQFPSKVLDYISLRKPIINIYKVKDCPTLPVLKDYPLALNIYEGDELEESLKKLRSFIQKNVGQTVPVEILDRFYSDFYPDSVAKAVLKGIERV